MFYFIGFYTATLIKLTCHILGDTAMPGACPVSWKLPELRYSIPLFILFIFK